MYALPVLMLIMLFRSELGKQKREQQNALAGLKKNDKVVTSAGILGVVVAIKDNEDEVTLRVDDTSNTRIRVLRRVRSPGHLGRPDRRRDQVSPQPLAAPRANPTPGQGCRADRHRWNDATLPS